VTCRRRAVRTTPVRAFSAVWPKGRGAGRERGANDQTGQKLSLAVIQAVDQARKELRKPIEELKIISPKWPACVESRISTPAEPSPGTDDLDARADLAGKRGVITGCATECPMRKGQG
jgi:hypothetical protein